MVTSAQERADRSRVRGVVDAVRSAVCPPSRSPRPPLLDVVVAVEGSPRALSSAAQVCGYRIVQEALTNVLRHAGAASADVVLTYRPNVLVVTVSDDGNGTVVTPARAGHGITGMRERAAIFGGAFTAAPLPGGGFRVRAELPQPEHA